MKRIDLRALAVGMFVGAAAVFGIGAVGSTGNMEYEYKVVADRVYDVERKMNNVGAWELVEVEPSADQLVFAVFRRAKQK